MDEVAAKSGDPLGPGGAPGAPAFSDGLPHVRDRFAPVAQNYATSFFHADPVRLEEVLALAEPEAGEVAVDVATGTGHVALAVAPRVARVIGVDLTPEMLTEASRLATERGIGNVTWVRGEAAALPLLASSFDLYTVRAAPHHFLNLEAALREAARVLKPGGRACFVDCSPPAAARDLLHEVEVGRDPSHVLSRTLDEWARMLEAAGLDVERAERRELDWDFEAWMRNMAVPTERQAELGSVIESASGRVRGELRPERREGRLWHAYWHALIRARRR